MVRSDEFRALSNLMMWLLRPQAGQQHSAGAFASTIADVLRVLKSIPQFNCACQTPYRPNTICHLLSSFH